MMAEDQNLEALFNEAANAVQDFATGVKSSDNQKPSESELLELYGLYKVATVGSCNEPQPGMFNLKGKAKWNAWKNKSDLSGNDAMAEYVKKVMSLYNWTPQLDEQEDDVLSSQKKPTGGFAPAVSRPHIPVEEDFKDVDTPFGWVKDNEVNKIRGWIKEGKANVNISDEEGLSLLHWAVDRGQMEICELLLNAGANPSVKDEDDQTPLDYALTCEHDDIIKLLQSYIQRTQDAV